MSDTEAVEMDNAIYEVAEGAQVLVKGKKVSGSRCKNGELHTGYQLAGLHPCACPVKKKAPAKPKAETKKKKAPAKKKGK
jgi:hypothetical protein